MLHGSAPFLSLQRSSVIPVNYQLVPLVMALEQPVVRMLIADDVGLGKTVEAGLILSELLSRGIVKRFLVVTPASLREMWQEALRYFFHIDTHILSGHTRREYEKELPAGANPWQHFDRTIVSIDYAKEPQNKLQILEQPWDLVLADEAHNAAKPHQASSDQTVDMERWQLMEDLARRSRHLLLVTATPHSGYADSFASLLRMLDQRFVSGQPHQPNIHRHIARRHVCQRSRSDVERWFEQQGLASPFPSRDHTEDVIPIHRDLKAVLEALDQCSNDLLDRARAARERALTEWLVLHLQKRALSSPAALRASLENRIDTIRRLLGEDTGAQEVAADRQLLRATVLDLDPGERVDDEEASRRTDRTVFGDEAALRSQIIALQNVLERAKGITPAKDSKLQRLLKKHLPELFRRAPKVIIFTRYKDTLDYLVREISKHVGADAQVLALHGDLSEAARRETFKAFEQAQRAILVATDVISEGLNLQHACSQIVHYELPWNPNRLEQRNGRVDRFGQQAKVVTIRTLVMDESLDVAILYLLIRKAVQIREDRGFCPPFFGDEVNIAHLIRSRARELNLQRETQLRLFLDPLEEALQRRISDPLGDEAIKRVEEDSFYGEIDVSLPDIEARLERSHKTIGSPEQIQAFVESALNRYRCHVQRQPDDTLTISLPEPRLQLPGIGERLEKATFDPAQALADPELTVLDIGHPLVRKLVDLVREDFFRVGADYGRTAAIVTDAASEVTVLYHCLVRFIVNTQPPSVIEELLPVAFPAYGEGACSEAQIERLLTASPKPRVVPPTETQPHFDAAEAIPLFHTALQAAVSARRNELVQERRELKARLEQEGDPAVLEWLQGIDSLTVASQDLLTATLYLPR
jgi:superfamily II DNA or RNA helicase